MVLGHQGASAWLRHRPGPQDALFALHVALLVLGLAAAQPVMWTLSARAWRWFLATSALTHAYKVGQWGAPHAPCCFLSTSHYGYHCSFKAKVASLSDSCCHKLSVSMNFVHGTPVKHTLLQQRETGG